MRMMTDQLGEHGGSEAQLSVNDCFASSALLIDNLLGLETRPKEVLRNTKKEFVEMLDKISGCVWHQLLHIVRLYCEGFEHI
jgi:hypothetical protein